MPESGFNTLQLKIQRCCIGMYWAACVCDKAGLRHVEAGSTLALARIIHTLSTLEADGKYKDHGCVVS
jgi:hypothetical protein